MKRIRFVSCTVVLILGVTLLLIGCGKGDVSGNYLLEKDPNYKMELVKNGKCTVARSVFDYSVEGDTLLMKSTGSGSCKGTISGKTITFASNGSACSLIFEGKWVKK
jgi:hypothetical protein